MPWSPSGAFAVQAAVKPSSEQVAMGLYDLEHLELLRDPNTSTKCLVAWGANTCVVAFRGTANKQNAKHDAKVLSAQMHHTFGQRWGLLEQGERRIMILRGNGWVQGGWLVSCLECSLTLIGIKSR